MSRKSRHKQAGTVITSFGGSMAAARAWITGFSYTQLVTSRYIVVVYRLKNRVLFGKAFERLERYAVKVARTVLRGP